MLVATRDHTPHPEAQGAPSVRPDGAPVRHAGGGVNRTTRFMTALQLAGSLLAIPVGLASAYSIYRANFSVETTCQALRTNIIVMIDKQVDAGTRRMLVGRDVETFEKTCGAVDPEATAAFKRLLAADKQPAATQAAQPAKETVRKSESRPNVAAKATVAPAATASAEPTPRDAAASDAKWLAAVRGALLSPAHDRARAVAPSVSHVAPATAVPPTSMPVVTPPPAVQAPPAAGAPTLPPPTSVQAVPAQPVAVDHPVPPGAIPEATASVAASGGWIGKIPFVGQMLAR